MGINGTIKQDRDKIKEFFIITGLPRSRTAWISTLFNTGDVWCFHDLIKECYKPSDLEVLMSHREEQNVGDADSAIPLIMDDIKPLLSKSRIAVIERDLDICVKESMVEFSFGHDEYKPLIEKAVRKTFDKLQELKEIYNPFIIKFEDLNDMNKCREMWEYLLPHIKFPEDRWKFLDEFRITINTDRYLRNASIDPKKCVFLFEYF